MGMQIAVLTEANLAKRKRPVQGHFFCHDSVARPADPCDGTPTTLASVTGSGSIVE
jgi:hypothetical protein